jgi:hypothetical protein
LRHGLEKARAEAGAAAEVERGAERPTPQRREMPDQRAVGPVAQHTYEVRIELLGVVIEQRLDIEAWR